MPFDVHNSVIGFYMSHYLCRPKKKQTGHAAKLCVVNSIFLQKVNIYIYI